MENLLTSLRHSLPGVVFVPGDDQYAESTSSYFSAQECDIKPACIVRPQNASEVATIVSRLVGAIESEGTDFLKFAIRSGGHAAFAGSANVTNGVTVDLRALDTIEVNQSLMTVTVGSGVSWGEVYRTLEPLGLGISGGRHSQVGVGGLTLGGGLSHFSGQVGLVCDNVLEYEVVLASGEIIHATENDSEYRDLFRALRGASNNFGIVTSFTFRIFPQGRVWGGTLIHPLETKERQLSAFHDFCANPSFDPNASLIQSFGFSADRGTGCVNGVVYTKPESEKDVINPFINIEPTYVNTLREMSITELTKEQDAFNENGLCQVVASTTFYLDLALLQRTIAAWEASIDSIRGYSGIVWSLSLQPIVPKVIALSPFLQTAIPTLSDPPRTIVIAQLTGTWKNTEDTPARYDPEGIFQKCVPSGFKLY
ncbi:hypothetical protein BDV95DRAFT_292125 [Massariosphaeria phaeospora]|uniref:FAD-binding PCMH-type domain-containing protein n=1 Tax=Massariosphaeria phaeospora TaxID=100035 RepID=A0A7C8M1D0_9PLEO|nr:hypothetical protein BDV95DRAFT_292125 [Massariosphaeria phaeospora]